MRRRVLLASGPLLLGGSLLLAPPDMPEPARRTLGVALWMALWWVSEVVPLPVTALLPLVLFPILGVLSPRAAGAPFANPNVFLFLGGFFLARAVERHNLHRRIALWITLKAPPGERGLLLGMMLATALLSMWMSNTATAILMVSIALSLLSLKVSPALEKALFIGIAYAASIGGLSTLVGTPPNLVLAGVLREMFGQDLSFFAFMKVGFPVGVLLFVVAYVLLVFLFRVPNKRVNRNVLRETLIRMGPLSPAEKRVGGVFLLVVLGWMARPLLVRLGLHVHDATLAMAGAVLLFLWHHEGKPLLTWEDAEKIPWGVIFLFGGGFALASAFGKSGLASYIAHHVEAFQHWPLWGLRLVIIAGLVFLTELTSNTATANLFLPLLGSLSTALHLPPLVLMLPATLAVSLAFMLPVATPPNALVFASGRVRVSDLVRAGVWMNLAGITAIFLFVRG